MLKIKYAINVTIAITITLGTNIPEILSAILAIGAFVLLASITNFTISDTVDSFPILSALYFINPSKFKLPAITFSPFAFATGLLSPVIKDSSKCELPSIISPSTAILSPAFEITMSPFFISSRVTCF